jgi:hypothetical protein
VPSARVYHAHSATSREGSSAKRYRLARNTIWTIAKNYPWPLVLLYLPAILAYQILATAYTLLVRRESDALGGRIAALRALPLLARKRKAVQARKVISSREMLSRMSPIENPLRVLRRFLHLGRIPTGVN